MYLTFFEGIQYFAALATLMMFAMAVYDFLDNSPRLKAGDSRFNDAAALKAWSYRISTSVSCLAAQVRACPALPNASEPSVRSRWLTGFFGGIPHIQFSVRGNRLGFHVLFIIHLLGYFVNVVIQNVALV